MNIQQKEKIFEKSMKKLMKKEVEELEKSINLEIENQIKNELQKQEEKEEMVYCKKLEKLKREYNQQIFNLETESKRDLLNQKKLIRNELKKELEKRLKDFTNTTQYENFLMARIDKVLKKVTGTKTATLGLTQKDVKKYGERYKIPIKIIEDKYIGGCTLEDNVLGIYMDHTILNSINEVM